ncbi:MAG: hypothetical protein KC877_03575 [Candidatus Kaiserbacteria bacterium]|nr:hypothetical protein [Candidatus Kaiserbacteria bacterium]
MSEKFEVSIPEEKIQREKLYSSIQQTEGFGKLSDRQQKLIRASIYTQQRAERLNDPASEQAVQSERQGYYMGDESTKVLEEEHLQQMHEQEPDFYLDPDSRAYKRSQNYVANWYCHPSIYALETEDISGDTPNEVPEGFFEAEYKINESLSELEERIQKVGIPCIIHISTESKNSNWSFSTKHSLLVLGRDPEGKMLCWEKEGNMYPFRITPLEEVFNYYNKTWPMHWGVRKLETKE